MAEPEPQEIMIFTKPWQGYVPGERAGFSPSACRALFDGGVARYKRQELNVSNLPAAMLGKLKTLLGMDGDPVNREEPQGKPFPPHDLLTREPAGSPSGASGPPPPTPGVEAGAPTEAPVEGTSWPPPGVGEVPQAMAAGVAEEPARPDELVGKPRRHR